MRLIDADDFIKNYCDGCAYECPLHYPKCNEMLHLESYAEENAKSARWIISTFDAQPVKRGLWSECWRDPVRNVISVICSACGDASLTYLPKRDLAVNDVHKSIRIQMPYCPKCGAKMCGGDTDGNQV